MLLSEHMVKLEILENASTQLLYSKSKVLKIKLFAKLFINAWIGQKIVAHQVTPSCLETPGKPSNFFGILYIYRGNYEQAQRSISSLSFVIVGELATCMQIIYWKLNFPMNLLSSISVAWLVSHVSQVCGLFLLLKPNCIAQYLFR